MTPVPATLAVATGLYAHPGRWVVLRCPGPLNDYPLAPEADGLDAAKAALVRLNEGRRRNGLGPVVLDWPQAGTCP